MDRTWDRISALVGEVDPLGLGAPASPEDLDALQVPEAWRPVWGAHDGQAGSVDGLLLGYFFLPLRGKVDSVEAELDRVPDGYLPIGKDFSGAFLVVDTRTGGVLELSDDGGSELVADSPAVFLERVSAHLRERPPRRWVSQDGRMVPEGTRTVEVVDLADWAVGESRDLPEGLVVVRVRSPDPAPFTLHGVRVDFVLDHPEAASASGALRAARIVLPTGPEGTISDAPARVVTQGQAHWLEAQGPIPRSAVLSLEIDLGAPLSGPRPLFHARAERPSAERATARLSLGDAAGALADALACTPAQPELVVGCALAAGDAAQARTSAADLGRGHPLRVRVFAESEPEVALLDVNEWISRRGDGVAHVWRAAIHERLGDFVAAADDTERALSLLATSWSEQVPGLKAALRRRRARIAAPRVEAPILEDSTEDFVIGHVVPVERVGSEWSARVHVTPDEAEAGRLVEFLFPDGERGAVRLPRGAGHGVRASVRVGATPDPIRVEIVVGLPKSWVSDADNPTLSFEKWDVVALVPRWKPRVRVAGLHGEVFPLEWPEGDIEVAVPDAGLTRADGSRGQLRVQVARS